MPKGTFETTSSVENRSTLKTVIVNTDSLLLTEPTIPAAKIGSLTTRGSDSAGTLTMNAGHGFTTGAIIDIYFSGDKLRHTVTVGTVSGNSVPISSGSGDVLPALNTAITAMIPHEENCVVEGDDVESITAYAAGGGYIQFMEDSAVGLAVRLKAAKEGYAWFKDNPLGATNPLAGKTLAKIKYSHGQSSAQLMRSTLQYN